MPDIYLSVKVEGETVTHLLERVEVEESDRHANLATLTFLDRALVLTDVLHEGLTVEIDLGRKDAHAPLFRGPVTSVRLDLPYRGAATVLIEAIDMLVTLGMQPKTKRWWNTTLSGIVSEVAVANGLRPGRISPRDDPTFDERSQVRQVEETDLALLHRLAADYDCKVFLEHGAGPDQLSFVSTADLLAAGPIAEGLALNQNLLAFSAAFEAFATDPQRRLVTTDPDTGARVELSQTLATAADAAWTPDASRVAALGSAAELIVKLIAKGAPVRAKITDQWRTPERLVGAAARSSANRAGVLGDRARRLGQTAKGTATGSVTLQPRNRVTVSGCGGRWSGDWYLAVVRHQVNVRERSYITSFVARR
jgi:phage protein D